MPTIRRPFYWEGVIATNLQNWFLPSKSKNLVAETDLKQVNKNKVISKVNTMNKVLWFWIRWENYFREVMAKDGQLELYMSFLDWKKADYGKKRDRVAFQAERLED